MLVAWSNSHRAGAPERYWPALSTTSPPQGTLGVAIGSGPRVTLHKTASLVVACIAPPWGPQADAVARAYERHAFELPCHLAGEFSAALLDLADETLFAVSALTSRVPLAFARTPDGVLVGSQVLSLLRHPNVPGALDETYLAHVVSGLSYPLPGMTALRAVSRLKAGEALVARRGAARVIRADRFTPRRGPALSTFAACGAAFWDALRSSAKSRAVGARRPCLSMSGGLDSAAVGLALTSFIQPLAAVSIVAPGRPDEEASIRDLEGALPEVRVTRVDCRDAIDLQGLDVLDLRDDPVLVALSKVPALLRFWKVVREAGFDTVFEGEGGDEIFALNVSPLNAFRRGDWAAVVAALRASSAPRSLLWRALVLPNLPPTVRRMWYRRWARRGSPLPGHLVRTRVQDALVKAVVEQYFAGTVHRPFSDGIHEWLSTPVFMGARVAHEQALRSFGLEIAAPLLDRDVIELALGIPPRWMMSPEFDRAFVRRVLEGRIPDSVRLRAKDIRLVDDLAPEVLLAQTTRAWLADDRVRKRLRDWVRFDAIDGILADLRRGYRAPGQLIWQLECLVGFAQWYGRASREYGVD